MRSTIMFLLIIVLLSGCATVTKTYASDGKEGYSITCSGSNNNWGTCYEKAGEVCGSRGYEVLEKSGDQGAMISGSQFGVYGSSVFNRSMIVKCR
jgi:uncharacterized protein YceK